MIIKTTLLNRYILPKEVQDQHFWKGQNNPAEQKTGRTYEEIMGETGFDY